MLSVKEILQALCLRQSEDFHTHGSGSTLDLIITQIDDNLKAIKTHPGPAFSDPIAIVGIYKAHEKNWISKMLKLLNFLMWI